MPYVEKQTISGDLLEIDRYFTTQNGKHAPRGDKIRVSSVEQEKRNQRHAEKMLIRKINVNFDGRRGDMFVTLTHGDDPDEKTAKRRKRNFWRRVRSYCTKHGLPEPKYMICDEKQGKWHHHVIVTALPLEVLTELWGHGRVTASILDKTNNYKDLAKYIEKHEKPPKGEPDGENNKEPRRKFARRWSGSLNLKQPVVTVKEIKRQTILAKPPAAPKGYYLLPDWTMGCDGWGNLYQYFQCVKLDTPKKPPPKGQGKIAQSKNGHTKRRKTG